MRQTNAEKSDWTSMRFFLSFGRREFCRWKEGGRKNMTGAVIEKTYFEFRMGVTNSPTDIAINKRTYSLKEMKRGIIKWLTWLVRSLKWEPVIYFVH